MVDWSDKRAGHDPQPDCKPDCFKCKLGTIQFDPYSMSAPHNGRKPKVLTGNENAWEKGLVRDTNGEFLRGPKGEPLTAKGLSENRAFVEATRQREAAVKAASS